jgi:hypothetical protein
MGFDNFDYDYDKPSKWEVEDERGDSTYDRHREQGDHLPKEVWNKVSHMPTTDAVMYGDELMKVANRVVLNKSIVESIWGKDFANSSKSFND